MMTQPSRNTQTRPNGFERPTTMNCIASPVKYNDHDHNLKRGRTGGNWNIVANHEKALTIIETLV